MTSRICDPWTLKLELLLLDIANAAIANNKKYYLGGGFSIDLTIGNITREHEDLDFYPLDEDTNWWKNWFKQKGYLISKDPDMAEFPNAFLPTNENNDYFADVYPIKIGEHGEIQMLGTDGKYGTWEGKSWFKNRKVIYKHIPIYIEDPAQVIQQKLDHAQKYQVKLSEKHQHDIKLFKELIEQKGSVL